MHLKMNENSLVKKPVEYREPLVSVIIPCYNQSRYLDRAIRSVLSQNYLNYEIIVVDDGSTDNSWEVVDAFGDKVRYIWQENKGLGGARNTGILASDAEFIGLLDADDEWQPTYLEKMMVLAQSHPEAVVYFSGAQGMDSEGKDLPQIFGRIISSNEIYQVLLRANFIIPSTVVFRRAVIVNAGLFEEKNRGLHGCEDWDLWLRLAPSHLFVGTAESLVRYRLHTQTFSANPGHMQNAVKAVIEKNFGLNDGKYAVWSSEKRRAFGGIHRYLALSSVQKQGNWGVAAESLDKALTMDPTLSTDLDLFYEFAFGMQSPGYRDTAYNLDLERNAEQIIHMLTGVFGENPQLVFLRKQTFITANYAIGLVAYNTNQRSLSRRFFFRSLVLSPKLLLDRKVVFALLKSLINSSWIDQLKQFSKEGNHAG